MSSKPEGAGSGVVGSGIFGSGTDAVPPSCIVRASMVVRCRCFRWQEVNGFWSLGVECMDQGVGFREYGGGWGLGNLREKLLALRLEALPFARAAFEPPCLAAPTQSRFAAEDDTRESGWGDQSTLNPTRRRLEEGSHRTAIAKASL